MKRERTREHLTQEEVQKLLAATKKEGLSRNPERDHCLLFLMVRHGLRVSEACQLKLSDIDLERKTIYIHRLKKGKPAVHPIYSGGELKSLYEWLKVRNGIVSEYDNLFLSEQRTPLNRSTVWLMLQKYHRINVLGSDNDKNRIGLQTFAEGMIANTSLRAFLGHPVAPVGSSSFR